MLDFEGFLKGREFRMPGEYPLAHFVTNNLDSFAQVFDKLFRVLNFAKEYMDLLLSYCTLLKKVVQFEATIFESQYRKVGEFQNRMRQICQTYVLLRYTYVCSLSVAITLKGGVQRRRRGHIIYLYLYIQDWATTSEILHVDISKRYAAILVWNDFLKKVQFYAILSDI